MAGGRMNALQLTELNREISLAEVTVGGTVRLGAGEPASRPGWIQKSRSRLKGRARRPPLLARRLRVAVTWTNTLAPRS